MLAKNLVDLPSSHEWKSQLLLQSCPVKPGNEAPENQGRNDLATELNLCRKQLGHVLQIFEQDFPHNAVLLLCSSHDKG